MSSQGPPQLGALPFRGSQGSPQSSTPPPGPGTQFCSEKDPHSSGQGSSPGFNAAPPPAYAAAPRNASSEASKPVFGVPLNRLYERDGLAVPMVVYQCIQAVDLFGLGLEGIYRQSGSLTHINKLKGMFDVGTCLFPYPKQDGPSSLRWIKLTFAMLSQTDSSNPALDFRNPENFYHDVNSVTGLLKQFFRDLPDPLLTTEHHDAFVKAASMCLKPTPRSAFLPWPVPQYTKEPSSPLSLYPAKQNTKTTLCAATPFMVLSTPCLTPTTPLSVP